MAESTPYDVLAATYDAWHETPLGRLAEAAEREAVFALWTPRPDDRILDVSCGTGRWALALAREGARVTAADLSPPMLSAADAKARQQGITLPLLRSDTQALPFPDGAFETVLCLLTLEFVPDKRKALAEMLRVLKPGGVLIVGVLTPWSPWAWKRRVKSWFDPASIWRGAMFLGLGELRRLLRPLPARIEAHRRSVFIPPYEPGPLLPIYETAERVGTRLQLSAGAFLALRIRRLP